MKAAEQLRLPQLAATINNERVRLRMPITPRRCPPDRAHPAPSRAASMESPR